MNELVKAVCEQLDWMMLNDDDLPHNPDAARLCGEVREFVRQLPNGIPKPDFVTTDQYNAIRLEWWDDRGFLELEFGKAKNYRYHSVCEKEEGEFDFTKALILINRFVSEVAS